MWKLEPGASASGATGDPLDQQQQSFQAALQVGGRPRGKGPPGGGGACWPRLGAWSLVVRAGARNRAQAGGMIRDASPLMPSFHITGTPARSLSLSPSCVSASPLNRASFHFSTRAQVHVHLSFLTWTRSASLLRRNPELCSFLFDRWIDLTLTHQTVAKYSPWHTHTRDTINIKRSLNKQASLTETIHLDQKAAELPLGPSLIDVILWASE